MTEQDLPLPIGHFVTLDSGLRLHFLDEGSGPVVLWLHGSGPGASGFSNFKGNYPAFAAAGFRNLVVDLPGFGRSDKPEDVQYNLDFFVTALSGFLKAVGVTRATVLGNSLGGAIALGLALAEPHRVEKLILMAPGGVEERETYFEMIGIQRMVELYNAGPLDIEHMRRIMSLQLFDSSQLDDKLLAERVAVAAHQPRNLFSTMMVMRRLVGLYGLAASSGLAAASPTTRRIFCSVMPPSSSSRRAALARSADSSQFEEPFSPPEYAAESV